MIFTLPRHSEITDKYIKKGLFFFSFFDLAYFGIWFLTMMLFDFPYNFASTIFLVLIFFGISNYLLKYDNNDKKKDLVIHKTIKYQ